MFAQGDIKAAYDHIDHQVLFNWQVLDYAKCREDLNTKCPNSIIEALDYTESFFLNFEKIKIDQSHHQITLKSDGGLLFLCKVCHNYLKKGTLPPKAASNSLRTVHVPESVKLNSYLEEALLCLKSSTPIFKKLW